MMKRQVLAILGLLAWMSQSSATYAGTPTPAPTPPANPATPTTTGPDPISGLVDLLAPSSKGNIVAEVNGETISASDLNQKIKPRVSGLENQVRQLAQNEIEKLVLDNLLQQEAARQKISVVDLKTRESAKIVPSQLLQRLKPKLGKLENDLVEAKRNAIYDMIGEKLIAAEAKKRNLATDALLKAEVDEKASAVSDAEALTLYNQNKQMFGTKTFDEVKNTILDQMKVVKRNQAREAFVNGLLKNANFQVHVQPTRAPVTISDAPTKGSPSAPVKIIEFTDYQCPFCSRVQGTLKQISEAYKENVVIAVRNFPLDFHQNAKKAAVAALCAHEQSKYWEYADKLWANQKALDDASLKRYASELSLNTSQFDSCLDSNKTMAAVMKDFQEGGQLGVSGTPAFFINGRLVSGALPFENFKKIIDEELKENRK